MCLYHVIVAVCVCGRETTRHTTVARQCPDALKYGYCNIQEAYGRETSWPTRRSTELCRWCADAARAQSRRRPLRSGSRSRRSSSSSRSYRGLQYTIVVGVRWRN